MEEQLNSYVLSRKFWNWAFENPDKVKPNHSAIYFFAIEHCNRLGWKKKYGLPTAMVMEAVGIKSYNTYIKAFNELISYGFFKLIEKSLNQYSSNIIMLVAPSKNNKALDKALDKALAKHGTKQVVSTGESTQQSTGESNCSIIKQTNKEQVNNKTNKQIEEKKKKFNFRLSLMELGSKESIVEESVVEDWLEVRKKKKATNTLTAFKRIKKEIEKSGYSANECIALAAAKDWKGFEAEWIINEYKTKTDGINKSEERLNRLKEEW